MNKILSKFWSCRYVCGLEETPKPSKLIFRNTFEAIDMWSKHISNKSITAVHCDVDFDGIGTGFIVKQLLTLDGNINNTGFLINKERKHGITLDIIRYLNRSKKKVRLLIIVDSSSNDIEIIKEFNGDVIIFDHHVLEHKSLCGSTNGGRYVVVSNMIDNDMRGEEVKNEVYGKYLSGSECEYRVNDKLSCGAVIYEWARIYKGDDILEKIKLYQWACTTLFSDIIELDNDRCQWYVENTIGDRDLEPTLYMLLNNNGRNRYKIFAEVAEKSSLCYRLIPRINRAIRAGMNNEALSVVIYGNRDIADLDIAKEIQDNVCSIYDKDIKLTNKCALKDITNENIAHSFCGLIASKMSDKYNRCALVYSIESGIIKGSFRGRGRGIDYKNILSGIEGVIVKGHKRQFGYEFSEDKLEEVTKIIDECEHVINNRFMTFGQIERKGLYHIEDMNEFKRGNNLWQLAMGNARVSGDESINIAVSLKDIKMVNRENLYTYDVLGVICKAFEEIKTPTAFIYIEYSAAYDKINFYLRNTE